MKTAQAIAIATAIDALTVQADACSDLATVQRESADKQRLAACQLAALSEVIEDIADDLKEDAQRVQRTTA